MIKYSYDKVFILDTKDNNMIKLKRCNEFKFREKEIYQIHRYLEESKSVLIVGIRRTGKTCLVNEALHQYSEQYNVVTHFIDVQDYKHLKDFYSDLLSVMPRSIMDKTIHTLSDTRHIPNKAISWLKSSFGSIKVPGAAEVVLNKNDIFIQDYWMQITKVLLKTIQEAEEDTLPVIGIDELPFMLENLIKNNVSPDVITIALSNLRKLRDAGLRMVISGSISLDNILKLYNIPNTVLGGLELIKISPFTRKEAEKYLKEKKANLDAELIHNILEYLPDYIPKFLDDAAIKLDSYINFTEPEDIDIIFEIKHNLLPEIHRGYLYQFDERLENNYTDSELKCAEQILDQIAEGNTDGSQINTKELPENHSTVLTKLKCDMFLVESTDYSYKFSLQIMIHWWKSQRGML